MSATNRTTRGGKGSKGDKTNKSDKGDTGKGSVDKVHQSAGGDNVRSNKNEDPSMKEKIRQIIELTQTSETEACLALHESDNDTERAINYIFENRDQNWETRVKKKKSRQNSTSKDGATPATTGSTDAGANNSSTVATTTGGGGDDDEWDDNPTMVTSLGALVGSGNTGASSTGGGGSGEKARGGGRGGGGGGQRMHGRQGGGGYNGGRDRDGGGWRGRERHENERNLDEGGGGGGRRGRTGLPPRGGGGARGRGGGRAGGSGRYPPRTTQSRTNSNYNNRSSSMGTWDNSNTWDGGNSREEVNHHSTAADDNWDEFRGDEWSTEEYTGSLSETKVFTSSQPTDSTPQEQDLPPVIPTMDNSNNTMSSMPANSSTVEQSMVQLAQIAQMQQAAVAAVSVHQSAGGTVPLPQQQQQQQQQSQPPPVAIVGTLNAEQAKYLNTLTQQNNMNSSGGVKYTQQQPTQQNTQQSQIQVQSQYGVAQTQSTGYITNYGQPYTDNTIPQQQQPQQPRIKQRARIPPPSKIPSSAVEMPGDLNASMGLLDLQFGAMDIMLDGTGGGVVGGYDSSDGKYGNLDTSGAQQQSVSVVSMDLSASSMQQQNVTSQQQQQQQMVDVYSPAKPTQQQSSINSALSQSLSGESMAAGGGAGSVTGNDHMQPVASYNTGARGGIAVASSTTGTNTSVGGVVSVGVGVSAVDTLSKVQQANIVDQQQQQQAQQAAAAAAQQQQQHVYAQQANFNSAYGSGPATTTKSNMATSASNYQTQQAYNTSNYTNTQKPTDFQTANVTANYNYANNNGGSGTAAYNTSAAASNNAYQAYSTSSNSYQQTSSGGNGNAPFITQANTYPTANPAYQQNTSQSVYGANTGLNNSSNYAANSNSTSNSGQYNSYGGGSGTSTATNHKSKDGGAYDGSTNVGGVSGVVTSNANSAAAAAAAAALSLTQTTATSGNKANTTLAKNSSGVVTNLPPGVTPVMSTPYLMASSTIPYFQQPIYQYDDIQLMQQRIPHMTTPFYDMSYQTPAAPTTLRDGSYPMSSDGRFARNDSNASPVPSAQTTSQPMALTQTAPGPYFFATPYTNIQPGYQFGPAMYSQLPAGTNAHSANNSTPQYAKQQQQPTATAAYSGGYGSAYDSPSQAQDYGKNTTGGYVSGGGGAGGGAGSGAGGGGGGSQTVQSKAGGGGASNAVSVSSGPSSGGGGTGASGSAIDLSAMYAKSHNTLGKVNSYEKQGFHSGTPPPFAGTLSQGGALAPSGTGYAPQMYIQPLPPHHQQHTTPLMHQPLHQMEVRHQGRRMDGGNNSGQRSQTSNPSKTGSKQNYQSSYWNPS